MKHKIFQGTLDLSSILSWIEEQLSAYSCRDKGLILSSEEALVNIIEHGYRRKPGTIEISVEKEEGCVSIVIKDSAPAFNPLLYKKIPDTSSSLEERKEGGLGIPLMRKYLDEIAYERKQGFNILTLKKFTDSSR